MKKILVTGATGFIGYYVVHELLKKNCHVIATSASVEKAKLLDWYAQAEYIPCDLKELNPGIDYFSYFKKPDVLIHLAWEGLPRYKEAFHLTDNLPRHLSFLQNLVANGLQDMTVTGTCLEYGLQEGQLSEDMPVMPSNPYAIAKNELQVQLAALSSQYPFVFKWIRLFYMYGKGQNPNSLLSQLDKALSNHDTVFNMSGGEQARDYLPVETVAENIVKIALQQRVTGVINCCSGRPLTVKAFVENYLQEKGQTIKLNLGHYPYPDYEPMSFWGDATRLKNVLNYD